MRIFRPADPSKRRPAYLQSHTKENFFAQLAAAVVLYFAQEAYWTHKERQERKELDKL